MQVQTADLPPMNFPAMLGPQGQTMPLAEGDTGTEQTISVIRQLVDQGAKDPEVNRAACAIFQMFRVPAHDLDGERRAIYQWVLRNIRFTSDIYGKETVRTAREILTVRSGDCDDINGVLIPALLTTIGQRVRLVTISSVSAAPQPFTHIYCEAWDGKKWIAMDAARISPAYGKGPEKYTRKRVWDLSEESFTDVQGLSGFAGGGNMRMAAFDPRKRYLTGRGGLRGSVPIDFLGLGRLGDDGSVDWTAIDNSIAAAGTGAANVIRALNTPVAPVVQSTPYGTIITTAQGTQIIPSTNPLANISPTTLLMIGGIGLLFVMMKGNQ